MSGRFQRGLRLGLEQLERREMLSAGFSRALQAAAAVGSSVNDDFGDTFAQAAPASLSNTGSGSQPGNIELPGDVDMFRFVAPVTGQMTIRESAAWRSRLDCNLSAYDADQQLLAQNDNDGASRNSRVVINVTAGNTYYVKAAAFSWSSGAYTLEFSTVEDVPAPAPSPASDGFQIDALMSGFTEAQQYVVQQAIDRWEEIIVGDLPDVVYRGQVIDDVQISISGVRIDGSGGVLGQSSATAFRSDSSLPYLGFIQLDTADVASMQSDGSLLGVIEHEIAHALGFGVVWSTLGLLGGNMRNPGFTGALAVAEYNAMFRTNAASVPLEADGGSGTALSHWDESVFGAELMTGWYNSGVTNPLSRITVASMADLGYEVDMAAADPYTPPVSSAVAAAMGATWDSFPPPQATRNASWRNGGADRLRAVDVIMESQAADWASERASGDAAAHRGLAPAPAASARQLEQESEDRIVLSLGRGVLSFATPEPREQFLN